MNEIRELLEKVKDGSVSVEDAVLKIKTEPYAELGYAKVDLHRKYRQGVAEIIYGAGKTCAQIEGIAKTMLENGQERILITRLDREKYEGISKTFPEAAYYDEARCAVLGGFKDPDGIGKIVIATGGTSDIPTAEEAWVTSRFLGNDAERLYDVGVAGLHRLLSHIDTIMSASVIIAIAGMEGALASVIGGISECPVIAVPTSVGYGASFGGIAALLSMLNSCAAGVSVVNIDNGFGAAFMASRINHMEVKR